MRVSYFVYMVFPVPDRSYFSNYFAEFDLGQEGLEGNVKTYNILHIKVLIDDADRLVNGI